MEMACANSCGAFLPEVLPQCGDESGRDQRRNGKKTLQKHGAKGYRKHVLFIFNLLGGRSRGDQRVEARYSAAGSSDEQRRE